jgi:hypothetical protein
MPVILALGRLKQQDFEFQVSLGYIKRSFGHQWLTPVILASQEAEIRRISVQSHPQANSS